MSYCMVNSVWLHLSWLFIQVTFMIRYGCIGRGFLSKSHSCILASCPACYYGVCHVCSFSSEVGRCDQKCGTLSGIRAGYGHGRIWARLSCAPAPQRRATLGHLWRSWPRRRWACPYSLEGPLTPGLYFSLVSSAVCRFSLLI